MSKAASDDIRHVRELGDIFAPLFFNSAVVNQNNPLFYPCFFQDSFAKVPNVLVPMERDCDMTSTWLDKDMVGAVDTTKRPAVFLRQAHYFPCCHDNNIQHLYCNTKRKGKKLKTGFALHIL